MSNNANDITSILCIGQPDFIRLGKPLYQTAIQRVISDELFAAAMELQTYKYLLELEIDKFNKYKEVPFNTNEHIKFLSQKIKELDGFINSYGT